MQSVVVAFPGHTQLFFIGAQQCVICDIFSKKNRLSSLLTDTINLEWFM